MSKKKYIYVSIIDISMMDYFENASSVPTLENKAENVDSVRKLI